MNHPDFTHLRRLVDDAMTHHDPDAATAHILKGLGLAEEKECPGEAMYFRAQLAVLASRFDEALFYLDKALGFNPADGAAYNDRALCLVELGQCQDVLAVFDQGIALEPDYATIHHNKGWFLNKTGRHAEALACFRKALELEPGRAVTWENMADAYEHLGETEAALQALREAWRLTRETCTDIRDQLLEEIRRLEHHSGTH